MNPLGIFAKTFGRPTPEENLDAVRSHGLGVETSWRRSRSGSSYFLLTKVWAGGGHNPEGRVRRPILGCLVW